MAFFDWALNPVGSLLGGLTGEGWSGTGLTASPLGADSRGNTVSNVWDRFKNGETNVINKQIADQNLGFQRESLEYNKALNQQIFDRADTAYQRAAKDAQAIGLNPMTLAGSGGADSGGTVSPLESMHNDFQMQDVGLLSAIQPAISMIQGLGEFAQGNVNRDLLAQQADSQRLDNLIKANENGLYEDSNGQWQFDPSRQPHASRTFQDIDLKDKTASAERNERENQFQIDTGTHDSSTNYIRNATDIIGNDNLKDFLFGRGLDIVQGLSSPTSSILKAVAVGRALLSASKKKEVKFNSKKASKDFKNNQAKYYNRMIRDLYEKGNSN